MLKKDEVLHGRWHFYINLRLFLQVGVMVLLALVVGAIFFGVEENMSGIQNRYENMFIQFSQYFCEINHFCLN